ncbi:hypothetical protein [Novosphingobium lindaniclasticum]
MVYQGQSAVPASRCLRGHGAVRLASLPGSRGDPSDKHEPWEAGSLCLLHDPRLDFGASRVENGGERNVGPDDEDQFDDLLRCEMLHELGERLWRYATLRVDLVGGAYQQDFQAGPLVIGIVVLQRIEIRLGQAGARCRKRVMDPFVIGGPPPREARDRDFPIPRTKYEAFRDLGVEAEPGISEPRCAKSRIELKSEPVVVEPGGSMSGNSASTSGVHCSSGKFDIRWPF